MNACDMCGKETELIRARIEDSDMNVCGECSSHGKKLIQIQPTIRVRSQKRDEEPVEVVIESYASIIRQAREKLKLKQSELAKRLNEKESIIHKLETAQFTPQLELARKLEKFLNIKLVEEIKLEHQAKHQKISSEPVTIGDLIKFK